MTPRQLIRDMIRYLLTLALLVVIWRNAHWSVALMLSLQSIAIELIPWLFKRHP